ncbi:MAG: MFS transporter [Bifidobacteriaceae bacterium]|jgi:MFS family permease|nr:MFS transporter [Bifidobacteriaceae bacterium]
MRDRTINKPPLTLCFAIWAGTALENFDFVIYSTGAALVFSKTFFPNISLELGILSSLGTYAVGFFARPLGGLVFSHIGDTLGRKKVLVITLFLMGFSTFAIGFLPDFKTFGILSPSLLVFLRILQGLGSGAEQTAGMVYLSEIAPKRLAGRWTSLVFVGTTTGTFLGALSWTAVKYLSGDGLLDFAWRWVFLSSIFVTLLAFLLRLKLPETAVFENLQKSKKICRAPIKEVFKNRLGAMFRVFFVNLGANSVSYIVHTFFATYMTIIGFSAEEVPQILLVSACFAIPSAYIGGIITDKIGSSNSQRILQIVAIIYLFLVFFAFNTKNILLVYIFYALGYALVAALNSPQGVYFSQLFPTKFRYSGITLPRELSSAIGGGLSPLIASVLVFMTGSALFVSIFCSFLLLISFFATKNLGDRLGK